MRVERTLYQSAKGVQNNPKKVWAASIALVAVGALGLIPEVRHRLPRLTGALLPVGVGSILSCRYLGRYDLRMTQEMVENDIMDFFLAESELVQPMYETRDRKLVTPIKQHLRNRRVVGSPCGTSSGTQVSVADRNGNEWTVRASVTVWPTDDGVNRDTGYYPGVVNFNLSEENQAVFRDHHRKLMDRKQRSD